MLQPARMEHLTAALRTAASSAGASAGGGYALLFAAVPGDESRQAASRLRAAAGFDSADAAREAAGRVASEVVEGLRAEGPTAVGPAALGEWGAAGGTAIPLRIEGRVHGVLIVSGPAPLAPGEIDQVILGQLTD